MTQEVTMETGWRLSRVRNDGVVEWLREQPRWGQNFNTFHWTEAEVLACFMVNSTTAEQFGSDERFGCIAHEFRVVSPDDTPSAVLRELVELMPHHEQLLHVLADMAEQRGA